MTAAAQIPKPILKGAPPNGVIGRLRIPPTVLYCLLVFVAVIQLGIVFALLGLERLIRGKDQRD
jgi:hypothetical protein